MTVMHRWAMAMASTLRQIGTRRPQGHLGEAIGGYRLGDHVVELARELCRRLGHERMLEPNAIDLYFRGASSRV